MEEQAYTNFTTQWIVGYKDIYPNENIPNIEELLINIPRALAIKLCMKLTNLYANSDYHTIQKFFSRENKEFKNDVNFRLGQMYYNKQNNGLFLSKSIFCTNQTAIELLRHFFSISYNENIPPMSNIGEQNIFKAMLIINDKLYSYEPLKKSIDNKIEHIAKITVGNTFSQDRINYPFYKEIQHEMFILAIDFFEEVSENSFFEPIYKEWCKELNINSWKEYVSTIETLFLLIYSNVHNQELLGQKPFWAIPYNYDPQNHPDEFISKPVLDYISTRISDTITIEKNIDYIHFRNKPLIKLSENEYQIVSPLFLLERLFRSLYFDFKRISNKLHINDDLFINNYTEGFMEKTLLYKYLSNINIKNQYDVALSGEDCFSIKEKNNDGEPDYYLRSKNTNSIILFENKSVLINGKIKEERDIEKLMDEFRKKFLQKANGKAVGIGQLVEQIRKLKNGEAWWDKDALKESACYPVLVVDDIRLLPMGIPYHMQSWYTMECHKKNVPNNKPLIIMDITILRLFFNRFIENGFEYYFDMYYEYINKWKMKAETPVSLNIDDRMLYVSNMYLSFSEYMNKTQFRPADSEEIVNIYLKKLGFIKKDNEDGY